MNMAEVNLIFKTQKRAVVIHGPVSHIYKKIIYTALSKLEYSQKSMLKYVYAVSMFTQFAYLFGSNDLNSKVVSSH